MKEVNGAPQSSDAQSRATTASSSTDDDPASNSTVTNAPHSTRPTNTPHAKGAATRGSVGRRKAIGFTALGVLTTLIIAVTAAFWHYRPLLLTGTGYAAHNACAVTFLANRENPETDLPPNPLVPHLHTQIDRNSGTATATVYSLAAQTAWYEPGLGCVLAKDDPRPSLRADALKANAPITPNPGIELPEATDVGVGKHTDGTATIDRQALRAAVTETMGVPNTRAVVVLHKGSIVAEEYAPGFTPETRQLGWSMTKSVGSALAGRMLADDNAPAKISLDDTKLFPQWHDERAKISINDLIRMTSGLKWDEAYELGTPITRMLYLEEDMGKFVADLPLDHAPGTFRQYSTGSTNLLCEVLADRSEHGNQMPRKLLFEPLGMTSAVMEPDASGTPACGSYLWATPRDWAKFGQFFLNEGRIGEEKLLPENWIQETTKVLPADGEPEPYGAAWWVNRRPDGQLRFPNMPDDTYWAQGHDGQFTIVIPSADMVIVRMGFNPDYSMDNVKITDLVHQAANSVH